MKPLQNTSYPPIPADITTLQLTKASNTQHLKAEQETSGTNSTTEVSRDMSYTGISCSSPAWAGVTPAAMVRITSKQFFEKCILLICTQWTYIKLTGQLKQPEYRLGLQYRPILRTSVPWELFGKSYFS